MKGFNRAGIYRMKQFYETYKDNEIVAPLVRQISWSHNVIILGSTNSIEEKEFYIKMCIKNIKGIRMNIYEKFNENIFYFAGWVPNSVNCN